MVGSSRVLLVLGLLAGACCAPRALAQGVSADPLPNLPAVSDTPRSLYALPPPQPPPLCLPSDHYFEVDPRLDPPDLPLPGPFFNVQLVPTFAALRKEGIAGPVTINGNTSTVAVPNAPLNLTVSPRFEAGYRLPSGFGEVLLAYRFLAASGSSPGIGPDGPAQLTSRLNIQTLDLDYASRELVLRPCWDMRWWLGIRSAIVYFSNASLESQAVAGAGGGGFSKQTTNFFQGIGPHFGLELDRRLDWHGLALVSRIDAWIGAGRLHQGFFEEALSTAPGGGLAYGQKRFGDGQAPGTVSSQLGLRWQPPELPNTFFFVGYDYEYWWTIGKRGSDPTQRSNSEISAQGLWLRAEFNYSRSV